MNRDDLIQRVLEEARADLARGVREVPDGSNRGPGIDQLGEPGQPWCALMVSAWLRRAYVPHPDGRTMLPPMIDGAASVIAFWTKFGRGLGPSCRVFQPGDLVLFSRLDSDRNAVGHHIELVESDDGVQLVCLGGNVRNAVRRSVRDRTRVIDAARPISFD